MASLLSDLYAPIRAELDSALAAIQRELSACDPELREVVDHAARYGGKLLRAALLLFCGRACGALTPRHIDAAAVVELLHTATLVHDDVIDDAERRRQGETVNARWGGDISIMLGDLLFARALEAFSRFASPLEQGILARGVREVCEGELLQLLARREGRLGEDAYLRIVGKKTGALYAATCSLGAALAGRTGGELDRFARFGRSLGIAFQITDDCLDIRGDEGVAGKTLGLDILGGKLTLPVICVRERGTEAARRHLDDLLAQPPTPSRRSRLSNLLAEHGAFDYCERRAQSFVRQGSGELAVLPEQADRDSLLALARYTACRER